MSAYESNEYATQEFADYLCKQVLSQEEQIKRLRADISSVMELAEKAFKAEGWCAINLGLESYGK